MFKKLLLALAAFAMSAGMAFAATDVNNATAAELDGIKGIGPAISKKIIDERTKGGPFKDWSDFETRVKGVGEKSGAKMSESGLTVAGKAYAGAPAKAADAKKDEKKPTADAGKKEEMKPAATATAAKADAKPAATAAVSKADTKPAADAAKTADKPAAMSKEEKKAAAAKAKEEKAAAAKADKEAKAKEKADKAAQAKADNEAKAAAAATAKPEAAAKKDEKPDAKK